MSKSSKKKTATKAKSTKKSKAEAPIAVRIETAPAEVTKTTKTKRAKADKPKHISALDCAAQVLSEARAPMRCKEMIAAMQTQGLWASPNGKTPEATLYSAILREISKKGEASRFRKLDRGLFEANV